MQLYGFASIISVLAATASAAPMSEQGSELMSPAKRQTSSPCTLWTAQTRLVGDGSPKDKWLWKQVTVSSWSHLQLCRAACQIGNCHLAE